MSFNQIAHNEVIAAWQLFGNRLCPLTYMLTRGKVRLRNPERVESLNGTVESCGVTEPEERDKNELEEIGSGKLSTFVTVCRSPLVEIEDEKRGQKMMTKEHFDPLAQSEDVQSNSLLGPALRFCGQLTSWTGNAPINQGKVGVSGTIIFKAFAGERASSHLKLQNEGTTAIFYSWQQIPVPHSFPNLQSQPKGPHFYFISSSGVILPGDTHQLDVIFKPKQPGIKTELWQLNTHPLLLQGASMQVTFRGIALYQDKTADQRRLIETNLEKRVTEEWCRSIVYDLLRDVRTPERPSSPAELYVTEEQEFLSQNPKLQYLHQPVEDLKRLWHKVNPGCTWDLSVDTLRQAVLCLPKQESAQEESLAQLNSLYLQLSEPSQQKQHHLTVAATGRQLWIKLFDMMADEAMQLRHLLGLPETDTWSDIKEESTVCDPDPADTQDEGHENKAEAPAEDARSGMRSKLKEDSKEESKLATTRKKVEDSKGKVGKLDEVGKRTRDKQRRGSSLLTDTNLPESIVQQTPDEQHQDTDVMDIYLGLLHKKVYALMEDLVDSLCDVMDELNKGDEHCGEDSHQILSPTKLS